eukprot:351091-Chlamydomonas_euryale.AAC.3
MECTTAPQTHGKQRADGMHRTHGTHEFGFTTLRLRYAQPRAWDAWDAWDAWVAWDAWEAVGR